MTPHPPTHLPPAPRTPRLHTIHIHGLLGLFHPNNKRRREPSCISSKVLSASQAKALQLTERQARLVTLCPAPGVGHPAVLTGVHHSWLRPPFLGDSSWRKRGANLEGQLPASPPPLPGGVRKMACHHWRGAVTVLPKPLWTADWALLMRALVFD
jgi:hypothetical protein